MKITFSKPFRLIFSSLILVFLAFISYKYADPICAQSPPPPDIPCIIQEVSEYIDGVMELVTQQSLPHIRYLSPAFNMTSPYYEDLANGFAANATYWNQLDGIAGNAYNFPTGEKITDWVARGRAIPAIGNKPMMLTEIGWYDFVAGGDKATAQANLKAEINKLKADSTILGAQLFNVFNNNPGWSQYAMTDAELSDVCSGSCGKIGANSAGYYSHSMSDFYGLAASHGMETSIEIANNSVISVMPGINDALNNGITPVVRIGVMDSSGGFDDPADYAQFIIELNSAVASRPGGSGSDIVYVIVGPNEPETECWASRTCWDAGCAVPEEGVPNACVYSPWTPFCENVSTPKLFCACDGTDCEPFEPAGFTSPNDVDLGQDDGTGKPLFSVYDRDTENFYDIPPVLFWTSPGANACGIAAPPPGGGGGGGGPGSGTCNPFNCGTKAIDFYTSLECAAGAVAGNLNLSQDTWFWFDSYGPYCHNETYAYPNGTPYIMPFGYNFWSFFDTYMIPGNTGGRNCGDLPPSADEIRNKADYPADIGMACPGQGDPIREPGHPAFDYYRGAIVDCPLTSTNSTWSAGNFNIDDPAALATHLTSVLNVNYQGWYLKNANPAELVALLEVAKLKNINPFILLGLWATESWFGQNGGCSSGPPTNSCGADMVSPTSCVFSGAHNISARSYDGAAEEGHGSNQYWSFVNPDCSFNIPTGWMLRMQGVVDAGTCSGNECAKGPLPNIDVGNDNVCRNENVLNRWYGYATDYTTTGCETVYIPTLGGITSWTKSGTETSDDGDAVFLTGTNGSTIYRLMLLHISNIVQGTTFLAGQAIGELYQWPGEPSRKHVHVEMMKSTDGGFTFEFIRPETEVCQ